jgi:hypothetical protein
LFKKQQNAPSTQEFFTSLVITNDERDIDLAHLLLLVLEALTPLHLLVWFFVLLMLLISQPFCGLFLPAQLISSEFDKNIVKDNH